MIMSNVYFTLWKTTIVYDYSWKFRICRPPLFTTNVMMYARLVIICTTATTYRQQVSRQKVEWIVCSPPGAPIFVHSNRISICFEERETVFECRVRFLTRPCTSLCTLHMLHWNIHRTLSAPFGMGKIPPWLRENEEWWHIKNQGRSI